MQRNEVKRKLLCLMLSNSTADGLRARVMRRSEQIVARHEPLLDTDETYSCIVIVLAGLLVTLSFV